MKISLKNFEEYIEEKILKRGLDYFESGMVEDLRVCENSFFQAYVEGTQPYEVEIQIIHGKIQSHKCDCPYDWGEYCKHEVAVLYALRDWFAENYVRRKPIEKTTTQELQELLKNANDEQLRKFVLYQARHDYNFRYDLLEHFGGKRRKYFEDEEGS